MPFTHCVRYDSGCNNWKQIAVNICPSSWCYCTHYTLHVTHYMCLIACLLSVKHVGLSCEMWHFLWCCISALWYTYFSDAVNFGPKLYLLVFVYNAVVTCEIKLFQNYFSLRQRPCVIILFQLVETCLKLFHRLTVAREYFSTCSLSLK